MKLRSILATLLLLVAGLQTATAQYDMKVWKNGSFTQFFVNEVDSVTYSEIITVTDIILSNESICLKVGGRMWQLYATIMPENAEVKNLSWESSDDSVATVDATGLVTAVKSGTCIITCRATDGSGVFAECQVNVIQDKSGSIDGRYYVDLGLPSGTLWATTNVGANEPEEFGDYFAWGETTTKDNFNKETYTFANDDALTKYCEQSEYGYNGFTDNLTELLSEDDAATVNWGSDWQIPSHAQFEELVNSEYTTVEWTDLDGVDGILITSKITENFIFMPGAGIRVANRTEQLLRGNYWSRTLSTRLNTFAHNFHWDSSEVSNSNLNARIYGLSVRPVRVLKESEKEHDYVDLGLPSGTLWATTNVGANVPEDYGDYFSWGETTPRDNYSWSTYTHCDGTAFGMNKYCAQSEYGSSGFTDELTELLPVDDAATANWGEQWQMPSREQIEELCNSAYTTTEWTTLNGVTGMQVTSIINGKSIFLPAGGDHSQTTFELEGEHGYFWSRTLDTYQSNFGFYLDVNASKVTSSSYYRYFGQSVRPVRVKD